MQRGGVMGKAPYAQGEVCFSPHDDAGKTCKDIQDCEGDCLAPGRCAEYDQFGCFQVMRSGHQETVCLNEKSGS